MKAMRQVWRLGGLAALGLAASLGWLEPAQATSPPAAVVVPSPAALAARCERPVYLSFDTGHMGVAPLVAEVLARQDVKVTFFLANERTRNGGASLDDEWAPWWKARAAEGHAFGSHTWDHDVWRADVTGPQGQVIALIPWRVWRGWLVAGVRSVSQAVLEAAGDAAWDEGRLPLPG
jgi:peptidoglycan/xylan/chitin deacetylase (PgdA/CDA1 family)